MGRKPGLGNERTGERRGQIVAAALACFSETSYAGVTMEDIRRRSGASNGSIYHHFKSKEQLAAAVYLEGIRDYQQQLLGGLTDELPARDGVFAIIRNHLGWVAANPDWARFLFRMRHEGFMSEAEGAIAVENREFAAVLGRFFGRHAAAGAFRKLPVEIFISLVLGPCQEYARLWLDRALTTEMDRAADQIAAAVWDSIKS
jgi:AcrR family transcriptional regulator